MLTAYAIGIFPWPVEVGKPITWFSPDPRFVLKASDLHIPKSLVKTLRKGLFEYRVDAAYPEVIHEFGHCLGRNESELEARGLLVNAPWC